MKKIYMLIILLILPLSTFAEDVFIGKCATNSTIYLIDAEGNEIEGPIKLYRGTLINYEFQGAPFAIVGKRENKKYYLLNNQGEWLYSSEKRIAIAYKNRVWEEVGENEWRLIDFDGNEYIRTTTPDYTVRPLQFFENGISVMNYKDKYAIINIDGELLAETNYFLSHSDSGTGLLVNDGFYIGCDASKDWEQGTFFTSLVDLEGQIHTAPFYMSFPRPYSEGWFYANYVGVGGRFLSADREFLYDFSVDYGGWFSEGLCPVLFKEDDRKKYIDTEGNVVLDGYEIGFYEAHPFSEGLACVAVEPPPYRNYLVKNHEYDNTMEKKDNLWGAIDHEGNWVIEPQFPRSFWFTRGLANIPLKYKVKSDLYKSQGQDWQELTRNVIINQKGEIVWDSFPHDIEVMKKWRTEILEINYPIDHLELNTLEKINEYIMEE